MEEGYISAPFSATYPSTIGWSITKTLTAADLVPLVGAEHWLQTYVKARAVRCRNCRLVQFEYLYLISSVGSQPEPHGILS